eukprot:6726023-Prymnesium_polylepis.1
MLVLNGHVLPFGMTIFQAIRQFGSPPAGGEGGGGEASGHTSIGQRLWGDVHTISYQLISPADLPKLSEGEAPAADAAASSSGLDAA